MMDALKFLNANSGALTVVFTAIVTIATAVYAVLTWKLVAETRLMRQVQTEPRMEITVVSFETALHLVRLRIRNIGLGPALSVRFSPSVASGGEAAHNLLKEFMETNFFSVGLAYIGPGQEHYSGFTEMTKDHDGKIASVLSIQVDYASSTGRRYSEAVIIDMSEKKGSYQLGKPHLYAIAQSLEKIQTDLHHVTTGFNRFAVNTYTSEDRQAEQDARRAQVAAERAERERVDEA